MSWWRRDSHPPSSDPLLIIGIDVGMGNPTFDFNINVQIDDENVEGSQNTFESLEIKKSVELGMELGFEI